MRCEALPGHVGSPVLAGTCWLPSSVPQGGAAVQAPKMAQHADLRHSWLDSRCPHSQPAWRWQGHPHCSVPCRAPSPNAAMVCGAPAPGCLSWMCLWSYKDVSAGGGQTPPARRGSPMAAGPHCCPPALPAPVPLFLTAAAPASRLPTVFSKDRHDPCVSWIWPCTQGSRDCLLRAGNTALPVDSVLLY